MDLTYATPAQANEYWLARDYTDWAQASETARTAALIRATEWIDANFTFIGQPAANDQVLAWPRIRAVDRDGRWRDSTEVPREVINATCWLAREALTGEIDPALDRGGEISAVKAGSVEVRWGDRAPGGKNFRHVTKMLRTLTRGIRLTKA